MTKYEELCELYIKDEEDFLAYRKQCENLARNIKKGLINYLDCENEDIRFYSPESKDGKLKNELWPINLLELRYDSFCHFGIGINLKRQKPHLDPGQWYIFNFKIKKINNNFILKIRENKFEIDPKISEDYYPIFQFIYESTKLRYGNALNEFLKGELEEDPSKFYII